MKLKLVNGGAQGSEIELSDATFGREFNEPLVHQVLTAYAAAGRAGTKAQLTKAEVRGGGKKPWRQKGTGQARAGSTRSPIWVGGGRAFAAKPRSHAQKVNRKMYRGAIRSMLSVLIVIEAYDEKLHLASRNLANVDVRTVASLDPLSLARYPKVLATVGALRMLEERLA
jgi:large subunit ribosomal protein L4